MALFSRRDKHADAVPPAEPEESSSPDVGVDSAEPVPTVGISVSSFGGLGAPSSPPPTQDVVDDAPPSVRRASAASLRGPAEAPAASESVPGLRDNVLLREALATLSADPTPLERIQVARQILQNHLFLRVKGDARALLEAGEELPLAVMTNGDQQWVLAYSSGAALQASVEQDADTETSAMGQPVTVVLSHVLAGGYGGLVIDPASAPASVQLPRELIERIVQQADPKLALKTILAAPRTDTTVAEIARAMVDAPLYVAVNKAQPDPSGEERLGVAEARDPDGTRLLEVYSHPLEVVAMGREDQPLPFTAPQLAGALGEHGQLSGVVLDPAGPWIRLSREDLAPVLALAGS